MSERETTYLVRCGSYCEATADLDGGDHSECTSERDAMVDAGRGHLLG